MAHGYVRGFCFSVREYLLQVRFAPRAVPRRCFRIRRPAVDTAPADDQTLRLTTWDTVRLIEQRLQPGGYGIRWDWT